MQQIERALAVRLQTVPHRQDARHRMDESAKIPVAPPRVQRRGHRRLQRRGHGGKVPRQMRLDAGGDPVQPLEQPAALETRYRLGMKARRVEPRQTAVLARQVAQSLRIEKLIRQGNPRAPARSVRSSRHALPFSGFQYPSGESACGGRGQSPLHRPPQSVALMPPPSSRMF